MVALPDDGAILACEKTFGNFSWSASGLVLTRRAVAPVREIFNHACCSPPSMMVVRC